MAQPPEESPPEHPARSGAPIQPDDSAEDEFSQEAETVDRLVADYNLVTDLAWQNFEGPRYEAFAQELAKYGVAVMQAWMHRGEIMRRCRDRNVRFAEPPPGAFDDRDDVDELAGETVALALRHFRDDVLTAGVWDHRRGASLRTFFITQCLFRFRDVYKRWRAHDQRPRQHLLARFDDDLDAVIGPRLSSPEEDVLDRVVVDQVLRSVDRPAVRRALILRARGYTHPQIAVELNTTTKAVERMIANERARLRRRGIA